MNIRYLVIIFISLLLLNPNTLWASNLVCRLTNFICPSVQFDELVSKDGLLFLKETSVPFTGNVREYDRGNIYSGFVKYGLKHGKWSYDSFALAHMPGEDFWITFSGNYIKGKKEGQWVTKEINNNKTIVLSKVIFKNGELYGPVLEYFNNSNTIKVKGSLINGKREGLWEYYQFNGKLKAKGNYINDIKEGHWDYYYPSHNKGNYKKGKKDGLWIYYNPSGGISSKRNYKEGIKYGEWVRYYKNGKIFYKGFYKDGIKEGKWEHYNFNGTLMEHSSGIYIDGKKIS